MTFNNLNLQLEAGIGMLTINRPKKLNALNKETILELHQALKALDHVNPSQQDSSELLYKHQRKLRQMLEKKNLTVIALCRWI